MSTRVQFELPPRRIKPAYSSAAVITTTQDDPLDEDDEEELLSMIVAQRQYRRMKIKCLIIMSLSTVLITMAIIYKLLAYESRNIQKFSSLQHKAYSIISHTHLNEYNADFVLFYHKKTRAELLVYLPSSATTTAPIDSNKTAATNDTTSLQDRVFGISFRTKPTDNTGTPHILEHSVLSGSKKYPVKEPFLYLMKGSLHTFLNAMTYNDRTVYPVASRNSKDFENLISVYLDAVFQPLCVEKGGEWILEKEGWRYDFLDSTTDNNTTTTTTTSRRRTMQYKGVVYSEMMGVYSNPESVLQRKSEAFLFPDTTYHYDSGGDPTKIPTLSYVNFTNFYHKHYHPSNAKIFLTGNKMDILQAMERIDSYLKKYTLNRSSRADSIIPFQNKYFQEPLKERLPYAVSDITTEEGQYMFTITWLLNDQHLNSKTELAFLVLDQLLLGNPSSILRQTLEKSQLGTNIIGNGLSTGLLQMTFAIGMKGVKKDHVSDLESLVLKTLSKIVNDGFDDQDIAAAMNSLEFKLREVDSGSSSNGISIFLSALTAWNYEKNPISAIAFETALQMLKKDVSESGSSFFTNLVRQYLIENNHRVHVEMYPSITLEEEISQNITMNLKEFSQSLSDDEYNGLVQRAEHLQDILNTPDSPENISTIPRLLRTDLPPLNIEYPLDIQNIDTTAGEATTIILSKVSTSNGILYVDVGFDLSTVSYDDIELLPLLIRMLKETGTTTLSTAELYRQIGIHTGGINLSLLLQPALPSDSQEVQVSDNSHMKSYIFLRGKCLKDKLPTLLNLMRDIVSASKLDDKETFIRIAIEEKSQLISDLISRGSGYVQKRIEARYDAQAFINDKLNGARHSKTLDDLLTQAHTDFSGIQSRLNEMRRNILQNYQSRIVISCTGVSKDLSNISSDILSFAAAFPRSKSNPIVDFRKQIHPWIEKALFEKQSFAPLVNEGLVVPTQVSYVGKGGIAYAKGERIEGSALVVQQYLDSGYLWETVRAKNGAYGVWSSLNSWDGTFNFISYRDPNLDKTLDAYDQAATSIQNDIQKGSITDEVVSTAIIGVIGDLDGKSFSPDQIGWRSILYWLSGVSADYRQKIRREVLGTEKSHFLSFANRLEQMSDQSIAVVSSDSIINSGIDRNLTIIKMS